MHAATHNTVMQNACMIKGVDHPTSENMIPGNLWLMLMPSLQNI